MLITVKFSPIDYRKVLDAINRVSKQIVSESKYLPKKLATLYSYNVRSNLMSQKFSSGYEPLNKHYVRRKVRETGSSNFWRYRDDLYSNITVFSFSLGDGATYWAGGIVPGVSNSKGQDITKYGLAVEWGNSARNLPSRPLFKPTMLLFAKNEWIREANISLRNIKSQWR